MLTTSIIFLVLAVCFLTTGWMQFSSFSGTAYIASLEGFKKVYMNPGFTWLVAAGLVLILSLALLVATLMTKPKDRDGKRFPYYVSEFGTLILGVGALVYGFLRNYVNDIRMQLGDAVEPDGLLWIVVGILAASIALIILIVQVLKALIPSFKVKVEGSRFYGFFRDYKSEMKKIVWTDKKTVGRNTLVVVITLVIVGALVALIDLGFTELLLLLIGGN